MPKDDEFDILWNILPDVIEIGKVEDGIDIRPISNPSDSCIVKMPKKTRDMIMDIFEHVKSVTGDKIEPVNIQSFIKKYSLDYKEYKRLEKSFSAVIRESMRILLIYGTPSHRDVIAKVIEKEQIRRSDNDKKQC